MSKNKIRKPKGGFCEEAYICVIICKTAKAKAVDASQYYLCKLQRAPFFKVASASLGASLEISIKRLGCIHKLFFTLQRREVNLHSCNQTQLEEDLSVLFFTMNATLFVSCYESA
jgi:hypothetical protein